MKQGVKQGMTLQWMGDETGHDFTVDEGVKQGMKQGMTLQWIGIKQGTTLQWIRG
jgi:hypothetical protein